MRMVVGGRYGLGSKDFTPAMAKAVFDNLKADKPRDRFTVGIIGEA
jgi:pyruvate-ferredoxin/flavodoxin oxidoreductase